ncbi:class I SAM-dependent methyltransferase [Mastigocoleus testarum]|uniref:Methyltransferase n=1 Tax=Mastigocoleus testarum BC008 TaxID=371196 RepID=A0A0V7ZXV3_9CYAN|nr:class I SAM-dependent methyltransferase [Mastigocoleus testarum]KST69429.1 methyltransferase [Mastigocoleus testarum BC008]
MKKFEEQFKHIYSQDLSEKKTWYSSVAEAYNKTRPRYPKQLINRIVELAKLTPNAKILELGCGPGIATVEFAKLGFSIVSLEPSPESCEFARENCAQYPNVEIQNITFEEWELGTNKFDAVIAATAFHWISPEIRCSKSAQALKDNSSLILLSNKEPQPSYEIYQLLSEVYQKQAPSVTRYEDPEIQEKTIREFGGRIIDSSYFQSLFYEYLRCEVNYSIDDYLAMLSTLSPFIALESQQRSSLFTALKEVLEQNCEGDIQTSYISAFHIARKAI